MRARLAVLLACLLVTAGLTAIAPGAGAADLSVAQEQQEDEPPATEETGEEGAAEEEGPLWTYQMARLSLLLLGVLGLGMGWWYYRLVVRRRRAGG